MNCLFSQSELSVVRCIKSSLPPSPGYNYKITLSFSWQLLLCHNPIFSTPLYHLSPSTQHCFSYCQPHHPITLQSLTLHSSTLSFPIIETPISFPRFPNSLNSHNHPLISNSHVRTFLLWSAQCKVDRIRMRF